MVYFKSFFLELGGALFTVQDFFGKKSVIDFHHELF